jgi:RHS repeat-associated protein
LGDIRYSPFGEIVELSGPPALFGFIGEFQDMSSGLTYLQARYYHPALGRFLTQDSLIPDVTNGQALNAYTYVYNDPINLVDPSGNIPRS